MCVCVCVGTFGEHNSMRAAKKECADGDFGGGDQMTGN